MQTAVTYARPRRGMISIILPAKNEAAAIERTLRSLPLRTIRATGFEVETFVLDGNSVDGTPDIARACGARVLRDPRPGKGAAFRNALPHLQGDYIVMLDADGTYPADAIPRILAPLLRGHADVTMGARVPMPGSMKGTHMLGNAALSIVASILFGRACNDLCTGLWGFRADALRRMPLQSEGFGLEAEMFSFSARMGLRVVRVPIDYLPRNDGTVPKLAFGSDGLRIVRRLMVSRVAPIGQRRAASAELASAQSAAAPEVQA